jgi:hypothetical protein
MEEQMRPSEFDAHTAVRLEAVGARVVWRLTGHRLTVIGISFEQACGIGETITQIAFGREMVRRTRFREHELVPSRPRPSVGLLAPVSRPSVGLLAPVYGHPGMKWHPSAPQERRF